MASEEPKVEIGLREVYDAVVELKTIVATHPEKLTDFEIRIRSLEMKVWGFAGIVPILTIIAVKILDTMA